MPLSPVRFGEVYKIPQMTQGQLKQLKSTWDVKGVASQFIVADARRKSLGTVVALTGQDAQLVAFNLFEMRDWGKIVKQAKQPLLGRHVTPFKGFHYWYTRQLSQLTQTHSSKAMLHWYLKTPPAKIAAIHTILATWLAEHTRQPLSSKPDPEALFDQALVQSEAHLFKAQQQGRLLTSATVH